MRRLDPAWAPFGGLVLIYNGAARCGRGLLCWLGVGRELRLAQAPLRRLFVPSPPGALLRLAPPLFPLPPPPRPLLSVAPRLLGAFHVPLDVRHAQEKLIARGVLLHPGGKLRQQLLLGLRRAARWIPALALNMHPARHELASDVLDGEPAAHGVLAFAARVPVAGG